LRLDTPEEERDFPEEDRVFPDEALVFSLDPLLGPRRLWPIDFKVDPLL